MAPSWKETLETENKETAQKGTTSFFPNRKFKQAVLRHSVLEPGKN
jgi:hypothetical protein